MQEKSIALFYREGSSDKRYDVFLRPAAGGAGWVVDFANGRRGGTLRPGTKTQSPVAYDAALKIYEKLVREKMSGGYAEGEGAAPFQGTIDGDRVSGQLPHLLNPIEEAELETYICSDEWVMQEKQDGERRILERTKSEIRGVNRKGLYIPLPDSVAGPAMAFSDEFVLDGEAVGDRFHAFDILSLDGEDLKDLGYADRLEALDSKFAAFDTENVVPVKTAKTAAEKRAMLKYLKEAGAEGVVFKQKSAPYKAGRPNSGGTQVKFKFYDTASLIVAKVNAKRSVALELLDGKGKKVGVGNVTIPANHEIPKSGDIVEVRYLYAYEGGSLFQPTYLGLRGDIDAADCTLSQLKYKAA
jgi:bifunctional non-homologous end joining protein LigD